MIRHAGTIVLLASTLIVAGCGSPTSGGGAPTRHANPSTSSSASATTSSTALSSPPATASSSATVPSARPTTGPIAGAWHGSYQSRKYPTTTGEFRVVFKQAGSSFGGTIQLSSDCIGYGSITGELTGNTITFGAVQGSQRVTFSGTITRGSMSGQYNSGAACGSDNGSWHATRR